MHGSFHGFLLVIFMQKDGDPGGRHLIKSQFMASQNEGGRNSNGNGTHLTMNYQKEK